MKAVMYHYVRPAAGNSPHFRYLDLKDFCRQLDWFEKNGGIVSRSQFKTFIHEKKIPNGYLLTFDDGLKDHIKYVLPELKKRGAWAIFFVCRASLNLDQVLAVHQVHFLLGKLGPSGLLKRSLAFLKKDIHDLVPASAYSQQVSGWEEKAAKYIFNYAVDHNLAKSCLNSIFDDLNISESELANHIYLSEADLGDMIKAEMTVASHGVSHRRLATLNRTESRLEILESVNYFSRDNVLNEPIGFCYPYGIAGSYRDSHVALLSEFDVDYAFSVNSRDIDRKSSLLELPRYDCNEFPYGKSSVGVHSAEVERV